MKTSEKARYIRWRGIVERRSEVNELIEKAGDTCLVHRGHPRILVMLCPCGCGEQIIINVDPLAGPAWALYTDQDFSSLTVYPSIWRDTGCRSHFIVWRGKILGIGRARTKIEIDTELETRVKQLLTPSWSHFSAIANDLSENPWSVLWACRNLVRAGMAIEDKDEGLFRTIEG